MSGPGPVRPFVRPALASNESRDSPGRQEHGRGGAKGMDGPYLIARWLSMYGDGDGVFLRAMAAFLGGGCLEQPALRARRGTTCRKRRLHGRCAARERTGQGCRRGVCRERLLEVVWLGQVGWLWCSFSAVRDPAFGRVGGEWQRCCGRDDCVE